MPRDYTYIIKVAADSPEQLRAGDLDRVFDEAENRGVNLHKFNDWLLKQNLPARTRRRLENSELYPGTER